MRRFPSPALAGFFFATTLASIPWTASADIDADAPAPADAPERSSDDRVASERRMREEAPSDEVAETSTPEISGESSDGDLGPSGGRRTRATASRPRWTDGPRRVPTPRGASMERAERLGLGTVDAAHTLLHDAMPSSWKRAAGRIAPRELRWPVDVGALGRGFGFVRHDRPEVRHNGIDIATPRGMVIRAAADGIVAYSDNGLRGYGNCVIIAHANGWVTLYAHADRTTVQPGYRVRRGERIGFVGSTGRSDGPHLHFELRVDGQPVDPLAHFPGRPWVEGRSLLTELRRDGGGHRRDHLGEISADYVADGRPTSRPAPRREPAPEPARAGRTARATAPAPATSGTTEASVAAAATAPSSRSASAPGLPSESGEGTDAVPASVTRLLARGPSQRERLALRAHPVDTLETPIRLEVAAHYHEDALRYAAPASTNVRAAAAGRVAYVGRGLRGEAVTIVLVHSNGWLTLYSGVLDATVAVGDLLRSGDRLAIVRDTRIGLAFELMARGRSIDPRAHLGGREPLVATRE